MPTDVRRERADLYRAGPGWDEVVVPPADYLAADGHGDPDSAAYADAVAALYTAAYAVRAAVKRRTGDAFVVGPLEGLWSSADPSAFTEGRRGDWDWTMLIPLPAAVTGEDVADGLTAAAARGTGLPVDRVVPFTLDEGRSLQALHVGPYDDEGPALARLHREVMPARGLTWNGRHHEIYLGDPRRVAPERLRTVLRQPVRPAG
ncbi:GyrI-like domain-containing protein [Cellulomonas sp. PS-H5]|uniref:GyrI-like domain-containing protein n=1 Tax=Cellulomonas sp. PS-H5 TaxID=2820400 RepID=UPI001C4EC6B5|nr:GyrI-like domain-containing protein [Cellulomonas sp. PS-H5]MBW0254827.1 GyrI-like domain-containing protein [Cellulomonas sp. PS-H5]